MKLKIAIFEPKINELQKIQAFFISSIYDIELYVASNIDTATKIINEQDHFDIMLINIRMSPYKKINDHFVKSVLSCFPKQNLIFLHSDDEQKNQNEVCKDLAAGFSYDPWMKTPFKPIMFFEILEKLFSDLASYEKTLSGSSYVSLKLLDLQKIDSAPCDIFIQLNEEKYVKVINQGEGLEKSFFEKYKNKGVECFHIDRQSFNVHYADFYPNQLLSKKSFESDEDYILASHSSLADIIANFGISEDIVETATTIADETFEILEKNNLKGIISLLKNADDSFIYDHSFLVSLICLDTAKKFRWYSSKHNRIICLAALLHDADLADRKFHDVELGGLSKLSELSLEQQQNFKDHPMRTADQLKDIMDIPSDVIGIVLKHHEGFGAEKSFPNGHYSTQLSALECLFVMSHEIVLLFYRNKFNADDIQQELLNFLPELHSGNFRKYIKEFEEVIRQVLISIKREA